ncbi:MAG: PLP-dependent aminotransferase family protein [Elainellaceae cyanobacterium]
MKTLPITVSPLDPDLNKSLYEQVADRLHGLIRDGTLKSGDRLPSVRKLKQQLSISMSTVLEAYRLLEDRGVVAARPQSGYYVKATALNLLDEPGKSSPPRQVFEVDSSLTFRVISAINDPHMVQLGPAVQCMENFPLNTINRLMGQVMRAHPEQVHGYGTVSGCEELRREVSKRMLNAGCSISSDEIVVTAGTTEAIYLALQASTRPGDTVIIESPTYYSALEVLDSLGLKALELPTHPRQGMCLDALEAALNMGQAKVCLLVSNYSNPLGSCMSDSKKKTIVELLNRYGAVLIEDDVYGDLGFGGDRPKAIKAFDTENRVLYCSSVSKTLSPGLRVGWCLPGIYQPRVERLKVVVNHMTAIAPQLAVAAFFANGGYDRHVRQLCRTYQKRMERMRQAIQDYFPAETRVTRPQGGHVLWVEIPGEFDADELFEEAIRHQISIAPGSIFSASNTFCNCFRLNVGLAWSERVDQAMQTLGRLIKKQMARRILAEN